MLYVSYISIKLENKKDVVTKNSTVWQSGNISFHFYSLYPLPQYSHIQPYVGNTYKCLPYRNTYKCKKYIHQDVYYNEVMVKKIENLNAHQQILIKLSVIDDHVQYYVTYIQNYLTLRYVSHCCCVIDYKYEIFFTTLLTLCQDFISKRQSIQNVAERYRDWKIRIRKYQIWKSNQTSFSTLFSFSQGKL